MESQGDTRLLVTFDSRISTAVSDHPYLGCMDTGAPKPTGSDVSEKYMEQASEKLIHFESHPEMMAHTFQSEPSTTMSNVSVEETVPKKCSRPAIHDNHYREIYNYVVNKAFPESATVSYKMLLKKWAKNYSVKEGVLYYGTKRVITDKCEQRLLLERTHVEEHTGIHLGVKKMSQTINRTCFWRGQYVDVANFVRQCKKCTEILEPRIEEAVDVQLPVPKDCDVWQRVEANLFGPLVVDCEDSKYIATITDPVSHFISAKLISNDNLSAQLAVFMFETFCNYGFTKCFLGTSCLQYEAELKYALKQQNESIQHMIGILNMPQHIPLQDLVFPVSEGKEQCTWVHSCIDTYLNKNLPLQNVDICAYAFKLNTKSSSPTPFSQMFNRRAYSYIEDDKENDSVNTVPNADVSAHNERRRLRSSVLQCRHCDEAFTSKISFRIHQRKHTEEARRRGMLEGQAVRLLTDRERGRFRRPLMKHRLRVGRRLGVSWPSISYNQSKFPGRNICRNTQYSTYSTHTKVNLPQANPAQNKCLASKEEKSLGESSSEELRKCLPGCITDSENNSVNSSIPSVTSLVICPLASMTKGNENECFSEEITIMQTDTSICNEGNENVQIPQKFGKGLDVQAGPKEMNKSRCGASSGNVSQKEKPEHASVRRLVEPLHFYHCNLCDSKFFSVTGLKMHIQCKHEPSKNYACSFCSYIGKCKNSLVSHISRQHNKKFQCRECEYSSSFEGGLERHRRLVHNVERHFPCQQCSYRGAKRRHLLEHEKLFHNPDVTRYSCPICNKHFKTQVLMKHHLISHTNQQLYSCKGCSYRTRHRQTLYHHIKRVHLGKSLKDLCSGPTEEDFQAIIDAATQELAAKEQRVAEDCLLLSNQNFSEVGYSSNSFLSNHYTVLESGDTNTDYFGNEKQMSEASRNTNQSVSITDGTTSLSGDDVSRIVAMTHNLMEKNYMLPGNVFSEKETVQFLTPLEEVVNPQEEKQTFTSLERMESCNSHIVEFINSQGTEISNTNALSKTVTHVNLTQDGLVPTENIIILPVPSSSSQIIPNNDVQHGTVQSSCLYQSSLLDIPQQVLEARYEPDTNTWNHAFQVDETGK